MTKLVLVVLRSLHHIAGEVCSRLGLNVDLNLAADTACLLVANHILIQLLHCVVVWPGANVQQEAELGLQELADALEKPFVRIDFAIVSLFNTEHEIDSTTFENFVG